MGFSHVGLAVSPDKFEESLAFYLAALEPLGYKEKMRPADQVVGMGVYFPEFWIAAGKDGPSSQSAHIAFSVNDRALVHAFYEAALRAGGKCNGPPGPRPQYTKTYYAAFALDPMGNNIEAVCLWPAWTHWKWWFGFGIFKKSVKAD